MVIPFVYTEEEYKKLEEENRNLKESLDIATKCSSKEEDGIIRLSEENKKLKEEIDTSDSVLSSYIRQYKRIKSQIYAINDVKNIALKNVEKLEGENRILKDKIEKLEFDTEHTIKFNNKIIGELKLENKKLKADYIKLSKIVETTGGYKASYVNELRDKIAKLEKKLKTLTEGEIIIPIYDEEGKLVMKS